MQRLKTAWRDGRQPKVIWLGAMILFVALWAPTFVFGLDRLAALAVIPPFLSIAYSVGWGHAQAFCARAMESEALRMKAEALPHLIAQVTDDPEAPAGMVSAMQAELRNVNERLAELER